MQYKICFHLLLFFCLPLFAFTIEERVAIDAFTSKPATIKVLLEKKSNGVFLEACGSFVVYDPHNGKKINRGQRGKRFYCYPHKEGIKWGEDFLGIFQLYIAPTSPTTTFLVNGVQYRGAIEVYHVDNTLNIINEVDVESFIKSILSETVQTSLSANVFDAITIIARTNAYYVALINNNVFWHTTAQEEGYHGMGLTLQNPAIDAAVDNTRYLVMTYRKQLFPGAWTHHCGGKTASYRSIFRKNIATPDGVISPFAMSSHQDFHWNFSLDTQELAKIVKINRVTGIDLFVDHLSGKVYAARIHDGIHTEDINFHDLQRALGVDKLKSNNFTVKIKGNIATFKGCGDGIGVGLCLYSATQMSERGDTSLQILSTFFPHTQMEKMRVYPKTMLSTHNRSFTSQTRKNQLKKKARLLHK